MRTILICAALIVWFCMSIVVLNFGHAQQVDPGTQLLNLDLTSTCTPFFGGATTASTNSTEMRGAPAHLCDLTLENTTTTIYYIHIYDVASAPTCSTTGAKHIYPIPPAGAAGGASGLQRSISTLAGENYVNGVGYCVTGAGTDGDTTVAAAGVYVNASYH